MVCILFCTGIVVPGDGGLSVLVFLYFADFVLREQKGNNSVALMV